MSLTSEKGLGKLEKGDGVPGIAVHVRGPATAQRPGPRQDTELQKANPFILEADMRAPKKMPGISARLPKTPASNQGDHCPCLLSMLMNDTSFYSKASQLLTTQRPFSQMEGTPVLKVEEQQQGEAHLYFPGKPRLRPSRPPEGLEMEDSEQTT